MAGFTSIKTTGFRPNNLLKSEVRYKCLLPGKFLKVSKQLFRKTPIPKCFSALADTGNCFEK